MYSYDRRPKTSGVLKVEKTAPVEFSYEHPEHGDVFIAYNGKEWYVETPYHKIFRLTFNGTPMITVKPQIQMMLKEQADKVLHGQPVLP